MKKKVRGGKRRSKTVAKWLQNASSPRNMDHLLQYHYDYERVVHPWMVCVRSKMTPPKRFRNDMILGLLKRCEIKEDSLVLEVGPGPGYFSVPVAGKLVRGRLTLADIQQEMLDHARKRLTKKGLSNVDYYLCNGKRFDFPDNHFDVVFLVTVIGEVENKEFYLNEFFRILKPGGILSISEQAGDPDKMSTEEVKELTVMPGFVFYRLYGTEINYTINFRKPGGLT